MDFAEQPPTSIDPYKVLDLAENAGEDEIKKAYRKAALKHHPGRPSSVLRLQYGD